MAKLFGTDGIRGIANRDLTPELALRLGRAAGHVLGGQGHRVVIGRDTRRSGRMLESALAAGLCSVGMEVRLVGHVPTPGLAYLTHTQGFVAGAVISASHNPAPDNGIKFFDQRGFKLADSVEARIEALMTADDELPRPTEGGIGLVGDERGLVKSYEDFLTSKAPALGGMRIVLDCANGATYRVAPSVFAHAGAEVITLCDTPDGLNINDRCGSTYPERLRAAVVERKADIGFAFDGDGDRLVMADHQGRLHDGDVVLALMARHFARAGRLVPRLVVGTVMTNGGMEATLRRDNIDLVRAAVGDRYVWEKMDELGALFGGEASGHVIFRELATTGDGILTALEVLHLVIAEGRRLADLADEVEHWPQSLVAVRVARRAEWESEPSFRREYDLACETLEKSGGRILVRPSGTEPVLRILVESRVEELASTTAQRLARVAEEALK